MCLIVLAWRALPDLPLIVAANRDEFHARPAAPAAFWPDQPGILAGRDLQAKGTWMGVSRGGRFAAVTNYRGATEPGAPHSRGSLVTGFLDADIAPGPYLKGLQGSMYSGFNLLVSDEEELWSMSNRDGPPRRLEPGIYGLGNTLLDAPEVDRPKERFQAATGTCGRAAVFRAGGIEDREPALRHTLLDRVPVRKRQDDPLRGADLLVRRRRPGRPCTTSSRSGAAACPGAGCRLPRRPRRIAAKPCASVEGGGVHLRRQHHLAIAALLRLFHQLPQDRAADALAAKFLQHRHAADVAVGQQPPGADRLALDVEGDGVDAGAGRARPSRAPRGTPCSSTNTARRIGSACARASLPRQAAQFAASRESIIAA